MKFTTKDQVEIYVRSMGKLLQVTACFETDAEANAYMESHRDEGVVAEKQGNILLANLYDPGVKFPA